ncbi:MAG: prohibitin family protein [Myxococcota bacterium]
MYRRLVAVLSVVLFSAGCTVVRPGEVGVKRTLGRLDDRIIPSGPRVFNPLVTRVIKVPIQTRNMEVNLSLPSKEGLNISAEISILYRVKPEMAPDIVETIGLNYERVAIMSVFRSAAADVSSRYLARDMYTSGRLEIEHEIADTMRNLLGSRGFDIEAVLLKSISLPNNLFRAIESKLEAEQQVQQMAFVLEQEKLEAARLRIEAEGIRDANALRAEGVAEQRRIEAQGIRDANELIGGGIDEDLIRWQTIEAFRELSTSSNTKVIITDSESPLMIDAP